MVRERDIAVMSATTLAGKIVAVKRVGDASGPEPVMPEWDTAGKRKPGLNLTIPAPTLFFTALMIVNVVAKVLNATGTRTIYVVPASDIAPPLELFVCNCCCTAPHSDDYYYYYIYLDIC